jgi:HTH-type transcriptional regulator/antitoxin HigA
MPITNANWVMHPGHYIKEEMEARGWSQRDLAFILGCSEQSLNPILNGKRGISPDMANALGEAFDVPAEFFANLQQAYDLAQARVPDPSVAARREMQSIYPVREMIRRQWIELTDAAMLETQLMRFFCVSSPDLIPHLAHAAKKSGYEERDITPAQLAWLFRTRQVATGFLAKTYSEKALRSALKDLEQLMIAPDEARHVPRILSECGVRFVLVEKLPNAKIDGVCFWLNQQSPVIGMSLQHDRIDNFWFVLRHEIEHVLQRHGRDEEMVDIDLDSASPSVPEEERIANEAAAEFCGTEKLQSFMARKHPFYYEKDVVAFARLHNRHPGIVIGQLRRRLNRFDYLTRYLVKIRQFVVHPGASADGWGQVAPVTL